MARRKRRRGRESISVATWVLAAAGVLALSAIIILGIRLKMSEVAIDQNTGCPLSGSKSVTAVLIDLTDKLSPVQTAALRNTLQKIRDRTPRYGRLEIYPLVPTVRSTITPIFAGCNPGSGRDVTNEVTGNRALSDRIWSADFGSKVDAVISQLALVEPQDGSPILEGMQSVAVTAFASPSAAAAETRKLVLISDMLQHTDRFSLYQGAPAFNGVRDQPYFRETRANLRGATVDVYLIVRETRHDAQQPPLYKFWVDLVSYSDGFLQGWEPLQ